MNEADLFVELEKILACLQRIEKTLMDREARRLEGEQKLLEGEAMKGYSV